MPLKIRRKQWTDLSGTLSFGLGHEDDEGPRPIRLCCWRGYCGQSRAQRPPASPFKAIFAQPGARVGDRFCAVQSSSLPSISSPAHARSRSPRSGDERRAYGRGCRASAEHEPGQPFPHYASSGPLPERSRGDAGAHAEVGNRPSLSQARPRFRLPYRRS